MNQRPRKTSGNKNQGKKSRQTLMTPEVKAMLKEIDTPEHRTIIRKSIHLLGKMKKIRS